MPRFSVRQPDLRFILPVCLTLVLLVSASIIASPVAQAAGVYVVDSTADTSDGRVGDGACDDGTGSCTLRAALEEANAAPGPDAGPMADAA